MSSNLPQSSQAKQPSQRSWLTSDREVSIPRVLNQTSYLHIWSTYSPLQHGSVSQGLPHRVCQEIPPTECSTRRSLPIQVQRHFGQCWQHRDLRWLLLCPQWPNLGGLWCDRYKKFRRRTFSRPLQCQPLFGLARGLI